ncbi:MAG: hypothetical protein ACI4O9_06485 [Akkermansia sp.]
MMNTTEFDTVRSKKLFISVRLILTILILGLSVFELFLAFRGLDSPEAMDQAQIARRVARGKGFTTQFYRPLDLMAQKANLKPELDEEGNPHPATLDFDRFKDSIYGPLHTGILALALKITDYDRFEQTRMDSEISNVYNADRVIAGVSLTFFLLALFLTYTLCARLFDEVVAATTVAMVALSSLVLDFAVSGLAQPMLMCLLLLIGHALCSAIQAQNEQRPRVVALCICLSYAAAVLMCLTQTLCIWCFVGLAIFCAFYFKPKGLWFMVALGFALIGVGLPVSMQCAVNGGIGSHILHSLCVAFGGGGDLLARSATDTALPFNSANFYLRLVGGLCSQTLNILSYMGGVVVVPFFLLALFNRYKKEESEGIKWLTFAMWVGSAVGMTCFARSGASSADQLFILFTPLFAAYGTALVFNFLARLRLGSSFRASRALCIVLLILISGGPFLLTLPHTLVMSIWTSDRGIPHYPPYYPAALNGKLHDISNAEDIIVTDQPWAVAWYADRKALWIPRNIDTFCRDIEPVLTESGQKVQGFLITPTSHAMTPGGIPGIFSAYGDFAPLVLEGKVLQILPQHNIALADLFHTHANSQVRSRTLASLVSSRGQYAYRHFLLGADIVYYSRAEQNH